MGISPVVIHPAVPGTSASGGGVGQGKEGGKKGGGGSKKEKKEKKKKFVRMAAGTTWEDTTLGDWDPG